MLVWITDSAVLLATHIKLVLWYASIKFIWTEFLNKTSSFFFSSLCIFFFELTLADAYICIVSMIFSLNKTRMSSVQSKYCFWDTKCENMLLFPLVILFSLSTYFVDVVVRSVPLMNRSNVPGSCCRLPNNSWFFFVQINKRQNSQCDSHKYHLSTLELRSTDGHILFALSAT